MMTNARCSAALAMALLLPVAGCGSKSKNDSLPAPVTGEHAHEGAEGEHEHAHGAEGGPVDKFHSQLAPLWHAPEGAQRVTDTCNAAGALHGMASDIVTAGAPAGAAPDYLEAAQKLVDASATLHTECGTSERKDFATKFGAVHEAFHAVAERAGQ